jgi:acetyl-CoA carboxylase carboxyltransferase component
MDSKIKTLNDKIAAHLGGGKKRIENNIRIKLTARERVNYLMDEL